MQKRSIRDAEQRTQTICLLILSAIGIGVALLYLRQVLVPFVMAAFLTMAVTPILDFLHRRFRLPRGMAIGVTIALASFFLVFLGGLVSTALQDVVSKGAVYQARVSGLVQATDEGFQRIVGWVEERIPVFEEEEEPIEPTGDPEGTPGEAKSTAEETAPQGEAGPRPNPWIVDSKKGPRGAAKGLEAAARQDLKVKIRAMFGDAITWTVDSVAALLSQGLLVMIFMMFLITGYRSSEESGKRSLSQEIRDRVREYLRVKILSSSATGLATYGILKLFGVDLALVFGLAAFFLNFIPNIGSMVAVLLPLPVILLAPETAMGPFEKVLAFLLPGAVQFLVGSVLEPRWMGKSLDLNPVVILMALIFWGVLWGPVGMLLAVPMTAVVKMLLERSELTQPVAELLSEDG